MRPLAELTLTRLRLFFREPGAIFWTFGFPIVLAVALGVAFRNRPPEPVFIAVESSALQQQLEGFKDLHVALFEDDAAARTALRTGRVSLVVLPGTPRTYLFDPTRPESRLARALADDALQKADGRRDATLTRDAPVTEPGSRYIDFLIPGLIGVTLMSSGMWGIGYVVVEMRTRKLLKRLVATLMNRAEFLFSFVLMRLAFLFLELPILVGFGWICFSVGVAGSIGTLLLVSALGALAFGGIGLLVASRASARWPHLSACWQESPWSRSLWRCASFAGVDGSAGVLEINLADGVVAAVEAHQHALAVHARSDADRPAPQRLQVAQSVFRVIDPQVRPRLAMRIRLASHPCSMTSSHSSLGGSVLVR